MARRQLVMMNMGGRVSPQVRTTALIIASAFFMEQLDSTVLSTALPTMARSFGVDPLHMSAALTAYLVGLAIFIPASGRLADRFGSRTVFGAAIGVFMLGSLLCAQATVLPFLIVSRLLQGVGGAMMVPVGRLVLLRSVPKNELVAATFWMLLPATVGPMVGPVLGGLLTTYLSWRWIFYINLPVGLLGIILTFRHIPQVREASRSRFDRLGTVLSGLSLACLIFGLQLASRGGRTALALLILLVGLVCGTLYGLHARRCARPILDFGLMRITTFRLSVWGGSMTRVAAGASPFLVPSMLQLGFGLSAAQSGLVTFVGPMGALSMRLVARRLLRRFGYRTTMTGNGLSAGVLMLLCALFRPGWPFWGLSAILFALGLTQALQFTAYNTIAYDEVEEDRMSAATSFYATFQQMSLSLGICIAAGAMALSRAVAGRHALTLADFSAGFVVVGILSLLACPISSLLSPEAGDELSGHHARQGGMSR